MTVHLEETKTILGPWKQGPSINAHFFVNHSKINHIQISMAKSFSCTISGNDLEEEIATWMSSYSKRKKGAFLPLNLSSLTPFMRKGLRAISEIESGKTASYGEIAARIGCHKGARAIGNVCNKNPFPLVIPCHRVIQGDGSIGGFAYNLNLKKTLLNYERNPLQIQSLQN